MTRRRMINLLLLVSVCGATAAIGDEPRPLANNPFSRPPSLIVGVPGNDAAADGRRKALDLRATLVGETRSIADVGGKLLQPGDEIDGYRLLTVLEDRAIFLRAGKQIVVYVRPDRVDDDD